MKYSLIIIAASKSNELKKITQQTIDTALDDGADMEVILVETFRKTQYKGVDKYIDTSKIEFRYNKALNIGIKEAEGEILILANNDLYFHAGWSRIGDIMQKRGILSASALSLDKRQRFFHENKMYPGYRIGYEFTGWCLFADPKIFEKIGKLDESPLFWRSDDNYAEQLKAAGIKHYLITAIRIDHLGSSTLQTLPAATQRLYTVGTWVQRRSI
jgi:hypothetical protein